jgi:hypothetical protein
MKIISVNKILKEDIAANAMKLNQMQSGITDRLIDMGIHPIRPVAAGGKNGTGGTKHYYRYIEFSLEPDNTSLTQTGVYVNDPATIYISREKKGSRSIITLQDRQGSEFLQFELMLNDTEEIEAGKTFKMNILKVKGDLFKGKIGGVPYQLDTDVTKTETFKKIKIIKLAERRSPAI